MTKKTTQEKLQQHQATLTKKRVVAAARLQHFNAIKDSLEANKRIEREVDLVDALNKIDLQLEDVQFHLDVN